MKLFGTPATHFAWYRHVLLGLIVLMGVVTLLASALVSRASAQEAWSGYLVVKASYRYDTAESVSKCSNGRDDDADGRTDYRPASPSTGIPAASRIRTTARRKARLRWAVAA